MSHYVAMAFLCTVLPFISAQASLLTRDQPYACVSMNTCICILTYAVSMCDRADTCYGQEAEYRMCV